MHPHPHIDFNPEVALRLVTKPGHLASYLQTRQHRSAHIVLMGYGMTKNHQQAVAVG